MHALNVLLLVFNDACLAEDLHTYISPVLRAAIHGFKHHNWAVRNSSMMVYAAVVRRAEARVQPPELLPRPGPVPGGRVFALFKGAPRAQPAPNDQPPAP